MKKLLNIALVAVMIVGMTPIASEAATSSTAPITTSAVVASNLTLNVVMRKNDFQGAIISSMAFGQLIDIGTGTLRSSPASTTGTGNVTVYLTGSASGLPYTITQSGTPMTITGSATALPAGALVVKAIYNAADNNNQTIPTGATTPTQAGATWTQPQTLYTSGPAGAARTVTAFYSVTDAAADGSTAAVPISQTAGTYSGTVTFTITA